MAGAKLGKPGRANTIIYQLFRRSETFLEELTNSYRKNSLYGDISTLRYTNDVNTMDILYTAGVSPDLLKYVSIIGTDRLETQTDVNWMLISRIKATIRPYVEAITIDDIIDEIEERGDSVNYVSIDYPLFHQSYYPIFHNGIVTENKIESEFTECQCVDNRCPFYIPRTPLGAAVLNGDMMTVELLLECGADVLLDSERNPLSSVATVWGHYELAEWLEDLEIEECLTRHIPILPQPPENIGNTKLSTYENYY
jgi:hypothetical protein